MDRNTIGTAFDRTAHGAGDHEACVFPSRDVRWTYRTLQEHTVQLAKGLIGLGIDSGDHVAVWANNQPEWALLQLAIAKIGAVLVGVSPECHTRDLTYVLEQSDATALFMTERAGNADLLAILNESYPGLADSVPGRLASRTFPRLKRVALLGDRTVPGVLPWVDVLRAGAGISDQMLRRREDTVDPRDTAIVQYTSGASGLPKGAQLTHANLLSNAVAVGACLHLTDADRLCVPVPFHQGLGSVLGTLTAVVHGATLVVPAEDFEAGPTLAAIANERCTIVHGLPDMFRAALDHPRFATFDLASLRTGIMAGGPGPNDVVRQVVERMQVRELTIAYGHAETSPAMTQTRPEDPISLRVSTVGRPLPGVHVKIVDETGREVAHGTQGELCCRGALVMRGYYKMPEATAAVIDQNGWLHTRDLAIMDEHGYCRIVGPCAEMTSE